MRTAGPELSRTAGRTAVRLAEPALSAVLRPRLIIVCLLLSAAAAAVFCAGIATGDYPLPPADVAAALWGAGERGTRFVVWELRLPRVLTGLLVGAAFGASGALLQTMTRNPLASPDMIGITAGAGTAVVAGLVLGVGTGGAAGGLGPAGGVTDGVTGGLFAGLAAGLGTQGMGLLGALATALAIYLLAWRRGTTGYRIILVGIGVSWMCTSVTEYLIAKAKIHQAQEALGWLLGNLNGRSWDHVVPLGLAMSVLLPAALLHTRWLRALHLGDEVAAGLGVPVQWARLSLLVTGVGLVAFGTAAAGPIAFVALAAPQIALRLAGTAWPPPLAAALTGALLVLCGDLAARWLLPETELPVGVVTGVLGAPFLLWLIARTNRLGSGG